MLESILKSSSSTLFYPIIFIGRDVRLSPTQVESPRSVIGNKEKSGLLMMNRIEKLKKFSLFRDQKTTSPSTRELYST